MAREAVRHIQELRKSAQLEIEDRIELDLSAESDALRQALDTHRDFIANETLVVRWGTDPLEGEATSTTVKIDGQSLFIRLREAPPWQRFEGTPQDRPS
jgi:hypothetical protein